MSKIVKKMNYSINYLWTKEMFGENIIEKSDNYSRSITKKINDFNVSIIFYDNYIIEHIIENDNGKVLYYLHFEFSNFINTVSIVEDLLDFAYENNKEVKKALFCCTSGITSSLFASKMQEYLNNKKVNILMDACDIGSLNKKSEDYDLVVLTPQIHYKEKSLKEEISTKIIKIPTKDYASNNYQNVL